MATKPVTIPQIWATNALYTTGPFIGQPSKVVPAGAVAAEGHRPGALFPTPAEYENEQQNRITDWIVTWVYLGSSTGAADAHIVETDSTGRSRLVGLDLNDAVDETVLNVDGVNTLAPTAVFTCTTGATVIQADIGNSTGTGFSASVGTGAGIGLDVAMVGTALSGRGLQITADAATVAPCVVIDQDGDGYAVDVSGGPTVEAMRVRAGVGQQAINADGDGTAVAAIGATNGTTAAVWGIGSTTGAGVRGDGGSTSTAGVFGSAGSATSHGVYGRTTLAAGSSAAGVHGEGRGTGSMGVYGLASTGIGVVAQGDLTTPGYPAMRIVPQDTDPSAFTSDGAMLWHSTYKQLRHCVAGFAYKSFLSYGQGSAIHAMTAQAVGAVATDNGGVLTGNTLLSLTAQDSSGNGFYDAGIGSMVYIKFSCDIRTNGAADYLQLQINDVTGITTLIAQWSGAGNGAQAAFYAPNATNSWQRSVSVVIPYSPPVDGSLSIEVNFARLTTTISVRNARLEIVGTF
jgi:hypothetical protein